METFNSNNAWMIKLPSKTPSKLSGFLSLDAAYPLPNKKKLNKLN